MTIPFNEFVTKHNGKYEDYDGKFGFQCVDLIRFYIREVLGWEPYLVLPGGETAKSIFLNFPAVGNNTVGNNYFNKVLNGPFNYPEKGDLVFWGYPLGLYWNGIVPKWAGHTAINSVANPKTLVTFDQNFDKPNFCRYVNHNYKGCLGWLHPKTA